MTAQVRQTRLDAIIVLTIGSLAGIGFVLFSFASTRWMVFVTLAMVGIAAAMILPARQRQVVFLALFFFTLPMGIDFNPIYLSPLSYRPINGFRILLYDIPLFFLFLYWFVQLTLYPDRKIRFFPWITIPYLLIWILVFIGLFGTDQPTAVKYGSAFEVFKSWLIFMFLANNMNDRSAIFFSVLAIVANMFVEAPIGFYQWIFGSFPGLGGAHSIVETVIGTSFAISRVGGTVGSPNNLGAHIGMIMPLILVLFFTRLRQHLVALLSVILGISVVLLLLTYSRGGWLGAGFGGSVALYFCLVRLTKRKVGTFIVFGWLLIVFVLGAITLVPPIRARIFENDYGAAMSRVPMSKLALNMIRHKPWLGVGLGNYTYVAKNYDTTREAISYDFNMPVHNEFLLIASEMGIPVLILFLFILGVTGVNLYRIGVSRADPALSYIAYGFIGSFLAWSVHHQFELMHVMITAKFWANVGLVQAISVYMTDIQTAHAEA